MTHEPASVPAREIHSVMDLGMIVTFYSYKGGVGRTFALANIGALLARWGYRVLCVDWDLEAPGLHFYFAPWAPPTPTPGLLEWLEAVGAQPPVTREARAADALPPWRSHVVPIALPDDPKRPGVADAPAGTLHFMPAGQFDDDYVRRVQQLDLDVLYARHGLGDRLEALADVWRRDYDFVLIDSRTGITDIGGICAAQLPDMLVMLFTANEQSLQGVLDVYARANQTRNRLPYDKPQLLGLPVPTRFEKRVEYRRAQQWLDRFARDLQPIYDGWLHKDLEPGDLLKLTRIPYVPHWSFGEELAVLQEAQNDPDNISFSLVILARLIAERLENHADLVPDQNPIEKSISAAPRRRRARRDHLW
ncbi:MAG: AAA family ATPase [Acidobacteriota bacterium]